MSFPLARWWRRQSPPEPADLTLFQRLGAHEARLATLVERQELLISTPPPDNVKILEKLETFEERLVALEKQVNRAGREQLKTGTLLEAQQEQLGEAVGQLKSAASRFDQELAEQNAQNHRAQTAARLEMACSLFPVLDGLDQALRSGQTLLEQPPPRTGLFGRPKYQPEQEKLRQSLAAWLKGLELVRQRQLEVLAAEGIQPIPAAGLPYDPLSQVVVEAVAAQEKYPPGTVVSELRRGYRNAARVLRYAEVSVAQDKPLAKTETNNE